MIFRSLRKIYDKSSELLMRNKQQNDNFIFYNKQNQQSFMQQSFNILQFS